MQRIIIRILLFFSCTPIWGAQDNDIKTTDFNTLSEIFVKKAVAAEDTKEIREALAKTSVAQLDKALDNNEKRLAFWVNVYNAYIQYFLRKDPNDYLDRSNFFKKDQIAVAGALISFNKIEHGIIRKSQWEYGFGQVGKLFTDSFERTLRVKNPDYRIHFALNCGAKDCPPVAIYKWQKLNEQFSKGTRSFLKRTTTYHAHNKTVAVTSLFSWYRGDFGGKEGTLKILKQNGLIPTTLDIELDFQEYNWTLELDNCIEL